MTELAGRQKDRNGEQGVHREYARKRKGRNGRKSIKEETGWIRTGKKAACWKG